MPSGDCFGTQLGTVILRKKRGPRKNPRPANNMFPDPPDFVQFFAHSQNRTRKMVMTKKTKTDNEKTAQTKLPIMCPNAAGIDIGATEIFVAVPPDRDQQSVRSFPTFTQDLYRLGAWL